MKKVAFTLGLAFFAIGLFAQTSATSATAKPGNTTTFKATPAQGTHNMSASTTAAKPTQTMAAKPAATAAKPAAQPAAAKQGSKPAAAQGTTPKKHKARHHKKADTTTTGAPKPKSTPAPKKN